MATKIINSYENPIIGINAAAEDERVCLHTI